MNCPAALLLVGTSTPSPSRPLDQVNTVRVHSHQSQPTYLITSLPEQRRPRRPTYLPTYLLVISSPTQKPVPPETSSSSSSSSPPLYDYTKRLSTSFIISSSSSTVLLLSISNCRPLSVCRPQHCTVLYYIQSTEIYFKATKAKRESGNPAIATTWPGCALP